MDSTDKVCIFSGLTIFLFVFVVINASPSPTTTTTSTLCKATRRD
jgi:hypothetical protein